MKLMPLQLPTKGQDVIGQESSLPPNTVRVAENVLTDNNGGFTSRPGEVASTVLQDAHSQWASPDGRAFVAAGDALYSIHPVTKVVTEIFVGLLQDEPVEFTAARDEVYFTSRGVLGKITASGAVRRPGVADLVGARPTLTPTVGALRPGRYGVAYSLVNDLGEESGLSNIEFVTLNATAGILVTDIVTASSVSRLKVYRTTPGGSELYCALNVPFTGGATLGSEDELGQPAMKLGRQPMPWGSYVAYGHGRLWTAHGRIAAYSDPFDLGVNNVREGYIMLPGNVTMLAAVEGGLFVGMGDRVVFLRGDDPTTMKADHVSAYGAVAHTGASGVPGEFFLPDVAPAQAAAHAVWLSDVGLMLGRPDGSVVPATSSRVALRAGSGRVTFLERNGIKQVIFPVESMTMGGARATDRTL